MEPQASIEYRCAQGCGALAADGHELCEPHRDAKRARQAKWLARKRKRARRIKVCPDCPSDNPRPLRPDERIWCTAHRIQRNRAIAVHRFGVDSNVDKTQRIAARTVKHADGRTRFHGQSRRGQQTHDQLNRQDLAMADQSIAAFKAGIALLGSEEAKTWARGERERVKAATANQGERATRHLDDVLERLGHFKQRHGRRDGE